MLGLFFLRFGISCSEYLDKVGEVLDLLYWKVPMYFRITISSFRNLAASAYSM